MLEITVNNNYQLSAELEKATTKIVKLSADMNSNVFGICYFIADVNASESYKEDFDSVHEWTATVFGIKKSMSYNMLAIGNGFVQEIRAKGKPARYTSIFYNPETMEQDFTITQIIQMMPFCKSEEDIDRVKALIEDGTISPCMTVKELKTALKSALKGESEETEESAEESAENIEYITIHTDDGDYRIPRDKFEKYAEKVVTVQ